MKIAVIGPLADSQRDLLGSWKGEGDWDFIGTVLGGIRRNNPGGTVKFEKGCDIASTNRSGFAKAVAAARHADVAILVLGESWDMSGEAKSRTSISLPGVQNYWAIAFASHKAGWFVGTEGRILKISF